MKSHGALVVLLAFCLLPSPLYPSTVTQAWTQTYGNAAGGISRTAAMAVDDAGDVYTTGWSWNGTDYDCVTIKYQGTTGLPLWVQPAVYDGPASGDDYGVAIALGNANDIFVTGASWNGSDYDYVTVGYAAGDGHQLWDPAAIYNGTGNGEDRAVAIAVDVTGHPVVTGYSWNGADFDYVTLKYDPVSGQPLWPEPARYDRGGEDRPAALAVDPWGNPYVTGASWNGADLDYLTIKYDANSGLAIWPEPARYDRGGEDRAAAIAVDVAGDPYVAGSSWNGTDFDYVAVKYEGGSGTRRWDLPDAGIFSYGDDMANSIAVTPGGEIIVTGSSGLGAALDYATVEFDPEGVPVWVSLYDGPLHGIDRGRSIAVDEMGNVYVTGSVGDPVTGFCDFATVKYNSAGVEQWVVPFGLAANSDEPAAIALGKDGTGLGDVYASGWTGSGVASVYATVKYLQPAPGWTRQPDLPSGIGNVTVKAGGCLAYNEESGTGFVYALKGNKTYEFYKYRTSDRAWLTLTPIPPGSPAKKVDDGAAMAQAGGKLYAIKGGGSNQFWEYDPAGNWTARAAVPGSNVSYGAGAVGGISADGAACIYLLKGSGGKDFYRYVPGSGWTALRQIPVTGGCGRGSCITFDPTFGAKGTVYALAGSTGRDDFCAYDVATNTWTTKASLPLAGSSGSHEVKDGAGLAWLDGYVYALKGNNTREFWRFTPGPTGQWTEMTSIGGTVAVRYGGALVSTADLLYALKGNSTLEFWMHNPGGWDGFAGTGKGIEADVSGVGAERGMTIAPNPLRAGFATVTLAPGHDPNVRRLGSCPKLSVYDATGRSVLSSSFELRTSSFPLDLRSMPAGVYLVKLSSGPYSAQQKLVIQR